MPSSSQLSTNFDEVPTNGAEVRFTRKQAEHLDKVFSELVGTDKTTEAALRINQGARSVVRYVKSRVS